MSLHIVSNFLQLGEVVDFVHLGGFGAWHCKILVHDFLVVDDAVALYRQGDAVNLSVLALESQVGVI